MQTTTAPERRTRCARCAGPLPLRSRADARWCGPACRQAAYRARQSEQRRRVAGEQAGRVPVELRQRARWVRHVGKRPMVANSGRWASTTDPSTWSDYGSAGASETGDGLGFVLAAGDGLVVVDLDHCVGADGTLAPWARRLVESLPPTYMERGASGTGLHLWFRGSLAGRGRRVRRGEVAVEVYADRRFIVVGDRVPGTPLDLAVLGDADAVADRLAW